jgi:hypothetical protein
LYFIIALAILITDSVGYVDAQVWNVTYNCPDNMTTKWNDANPWWCWIFGSCERSCIFRAQGYYKFRFLFQETLEEGAHASFTVTAPERGPYHINVTFKDADVGIPSGWSIEVGNKGIEHQFCPTNESSYCASVGTGGWTTYTCPNKTCLRENTLIVFRNREEPAATVSDLNFTCPGNHHTTLANITIYGPDNTCATNDGCCFDADCCPPGGGTCCPPNEKCQQMLDSGGNPAGFCCTKFLCDDACFTELLCVRDCQQCLGNAGCCGDEICELECQRDAAMFPIKAILYGIAAGFGTIMMQYTE